jgi:hypothetical protein
VFDYTFVASLPIAPIDELMLFTINGNMGFQESTTLRFDINSDRSMVFNQDCDVTTYEPNNFKVDRYFDLD